MNYLELAALIAGTSFIMMVFVVKTNLKKAPVRIRVKK